MSLGRQSFNNSERSAPCNGIRKSHIYFTQKKVPLILWRTLNSLGYRVSSLKHVYVFKAAMTLIAFFRARTPLGQHNQLHYKYLISDAVMAVWITQFQVLKCLSFIRKIPWHILKPKHPIIHNWLMPFSVANIENVNRRSWL